MERDELLKKVTLLRRRQVSCRQSMEILREQWRKDQDELKRLAPDAITAGLVVTLEIDEP